MTHYAYLHTLLDHIEKGETILANKLVQNRYGRRASRKKGTTPAEIKAAKKRSAVHAAWVKKQKDADHIVAIASFRQEPDEFVIELVEE